MEKTVREYLDKIMDDIKKVVDGDLYYNGICLKDLALEYGTPLKVTFLDVIKKRVTTLKNAFSKAKSDLNYNGNFIYLNANKANYNGLEIEEAFKHGDGLETSSYYDLLMTEAMFKKHKEFFNKYIVCNGYKQRDYVDKIIELKKKGYNIIDVIDSLEEYNYLKGFNLDVEVGLRIHIPALYAEEGDVIENDRFGLVDEEFEYIINDIKNTNLILSTIHFHQRGFEYEEDKFTINFEKCFKNYYVKAKKLNESVCNFDMGGGTPLPDNGLFDYDEWARYVFKLLSKISKENDVEEPNLFSENGKYSVKDSLVTIYKVVGVKNTDAYPWNIVDGSLLIAMPEMYALGEYINVEPINGIGAETYKARLAGITCDCDDVYYQKDKGYINLPKINEDLFIGLTGTGSYQNSMNGYGGVHHCLLPEEKNIVISQKDGKIDVLVRRDLQSINEIMKLMKM